MVVAKLGVSAPFAFYFAKLDKEMGLGEAPAKNSHGVWFGQGLHSVCYS